MGLGNPLEHNCIAELSLLEAGGEGDSEGESNFLCQVALISQGHSPEKGAIVASWEPTLTAAGGRRHHIGKGGGMGSGASST